MRVIVPQLFDSLRRSRLDGTNPPPIKARKQGLELGMAQRHQAILDPWPGEGVFFQPLVSHHNAAAIPVDQLQPVRFTRPEHEDRAGERVPA